MRVLVVEDEALLSLAVEKALHQVGHEVVAIASTASQALKAVSDHGAELALVDIHLADGRTAGLRLARELHQSFGISTLFVSGQPNAARSHRDFALGCLSKPYGSEDLQAAVRVAELVMRGVSPEASLVPDALELYHFTI